jgi:hypothetical protein
MFTTFEYFSLYRHVIIEHVHLSIFLSYNTLQMVNVIGWIVEFLIIYIITARVIRYTVRPNCLGRGLKSSQWDIEQICYFLLYFSEMIIQLLLTAKNNRPILSSTNITLRTDLERGRFGEEEWFGGASFLWVLWGLGNHHCCCHKLGRDILMRYLITSVLSR